MSSTSSSGEEDGDAEWKAAIHSASVAAAPAPLDSAPPHHQQVDNHKSHNLKHYQLKAQKILNDIIEKSIEVVSSTDPFPDEDSANNGGGIQLFKHAPRGIVFDHVDEVQRPNKKPRILPGEEIDEKSKKFKRQVQSVAVDGIDILAAARNAGQKSLAKLEAREAVVKAAAEREEERVAVLKKVRGERWLPSLAKDRHMVFQGC